MAATGDGPQSPSATVATPEEMAARAVVPVLCYHQVRDWAGDDSQYTRENLVIPPAKLGEQLDAMKAAGYEAISPEQYYDHLTTGAELPAKPVLLSFDDGKDNQAGAAVAELRKRGMHGTFFIMSVVIGNSGWVTKADLKAMADAGMTIGSHTWDHHRVDKYTSKDVEEQLIKPRETLRAASGQEVLDFAYPYGAWNPQGADFVKRAGYRTGYQLMDKPVSPTQPLYSIRRQLAVSTWSGPQVVAKLDGFATSGRDTTYSAG
ncbi:MAG: polysaccharide deacetylase family protein [Dermatophilus congolensis]|nr:polysaccharide deacetylase family protein [Dermatophilus congolensis]